MKPFNYQELKDQLSKIEIKLEGDEVATYFDGRQKSRKTVSTRYEIFDFRPFVLQCVKEAMKHYTIAKYELLIYKGVQEIRLYSEEETINGEIFTRAFYLINSSDKSKALSFSYGLKHKNFHFISKKGSITKKHYTGITEYVNERVDMDDSIFQDQLEILKKIIGDKIYMSSVQQIVTESEVLAESKITLKRNLGNLYLSMYSSSHMTEMHEEDRKKLYVPYYAKDRVNDFTENGKDFMVDSFFVFKNYLKMFKDRDATTIKKESERIAKLSVISNRNSFIEELLNA